MYKKTLLTRRILAMAAATALFVSPSVSLAQNIQKADSSKAGTIKVNGKVTNITPDRTTNGGKTAVNHFSNFDLDKGNIANLHLEKSDMLVNFVDEKANINGIVNSVKNNKVGGNLYFLSSKGIAVGASGAINADKVNLITPQAKVYQAMVDSSNLNEQTLSREALDSYPLNPSGSIVIEGSINARQGINLIARDIQVKGTLNNTSNIDYSKIVNTTDENGNIISAGLSSQSLALTSDNDGIYISSHVNNDEVTLDQGLTDFTGIGVEHLQSPAVAKIDIDEGAVIKSDADVDICAVVTSNRSPLNGSDTLSNVRSFNTSVDVAGSIEAQNINLKSNINDQFIRASVVAPSSDEDAGVDFAKLMDIFSMINLQNILQDYGHIANAFVARVDETNLNIKSTASLLAAKNINLDSTSAFKTQLISQVTSTDDYGGGAINYAYLDNSAGMNIAGKLAAAGDINLNAASGADITSMANIKFDKSNNTASTLALNVAYGSNKSNLTVEKSAGIDAGGKLTLASLASTPISMQNAIQREGSALGALTLNGDKMSSESLLNVSGELKAKGDINLSSKYQAATKEVLSGIIVNNPTSNATQTEQEAAKTQQAVDTINNFSKEQGGADSGSTSVTVNGTIVYESNNAFLAADKVTSSSGTINIETSADLGDAQSGGFSITAANKGGQVSPVFLFQSMTNNSILQLTGDLTATDINVKSNVVINNPRLDKVLSDIGNISENLSKVYDKISSKVTSSGTEEQKAAFEEAKKRLETYVDSVKSGTNPQQALISSTQDIINDLKEYLASDEDVQKIISTLSRAVDATQIANFYADKETVLTTEEKNPDYTVTASSLTNLLTNKSNIDIAQGLTFKATSGDVSLNSEIEDRTVNVAGHILPKNLKTAATDLVVGVNLLGDDNLINSDGALTISGKKVTINAINDINHLLINNGSGIGANSAYHAVGTVGYAGGSSNAVANLGAMPLITATDSLNVSADNDTHLFNAAGGFSFGSGSAGIGVGVAVNNFDVSTGAALGGVAMGSINSPKINVNANTTGMVNALSVAGGISTSSQSSKSYEQRADEEKATSSGIAILDSLSEYVGEDTLKTISDATEYFNKAKGVISETKGKIDNAQAENTGAKDKPDTKVASTSEVSSSDSEPKVTFDGAGSASVNLGSRNTITSFNALKARSVSEMNVASLDKNFTGAWSGAGALNFRGGKSTSVAIAGAVALNDVDSKVISNISNNSGLGGVINNSAEKSGALVAAGLGLTVSSTSGKNFAGAASASVNLSDNAVKANLSNNVVAAAKNIANLAKNSDTQITGGINVAVAAGGSSGVAIGGSGVWSDISNNVDALVEGGSYNLTGDFKNQVGTTLTDIAAGAGVGVSTGGYGVQGVFTYNKVLNNSAARVLDSSITSKNFINTSADSTSGLKTYDSTLSNAGLDVNGDSYTDFAKIGEVSSTKTSINNQANGGEAVDGDTSKGYNNSDYGNKIITASLAIAGSKKGSAQASLAISDVDNDFSAEVTNTDLNITSTSDIVATSNTLDVNAAAGAAIAASGFGAGGSVSWQVNDNDVTAGFDGGSSKKSFSADTLNINTNNKALEVNVAGQVSGGSGVAAGLGLAYNALSDNTDSYLKNTEAEGKSAVKLSAQSGGKVYAVGAGVAASTGSAALNGVVAINHGSNSTTSAVENISAAQLKSLNVDVKDSVDKMAIVGGLTLSGGNVAIGGSVALNDVGALSATQQSKATIKDSVLKVTGGLNVNVADDTQLLTVGVGCGLSSGSVAVQGAAAVATINKDVGIDVKDSDLTAKNISLTASTSEDLTTTADVLSVSSTAAVGAGVSIANDNSKTNINIANKSLKADSIAINSKSDSKVLTVGIGGSGSSSGAAVTGSVALNNLAANTSNNIKGVTIEGSKGVNIVAAGDEAIANYGGNLALTGSGASVGLSVSINNIDSKVSSNVEKATFKGSANSTKFSVEDSVEDSAIRSKVVDADTFNSTTSLKDSRKGAQYTGVLVDASATHDIKSALFNVGATGTGASVNGTVNINRVNGSTSAITKDSTFDVTSGDVNVVAHDYTNTSGLVGTASISLEGAGVGIGSDSAVLNRKTIAMLDGTGNKNSLKAKNVKVEAEGKQGVSSLVAGVAANGIGAGLSNGVAVDLMSSKTSASISDFKGSADSLDINSNQKTNLNTMGVSAGLSITGAGVGLSVDVINNRAKTTSSVSGMDLSISGNTNVKSNSDTNINYELYDVGGAAVGGGVAGAVAVANNTATTSTDINGNLDTKGNTTITSSNNLNFKDRAVVGGVAGLGGGVGVGVTINTIDSSVNTNIDGTVKSGGDLNISANENRNVGQTAAAISAGAGAASANVMITNVGKALENDYDSDLNSEDDGAHVSTSEEIDKANDAASNSKLGGDEISVGGMNVGLVKDSEKKIGKGGSKESGTHIKVGGTVEAQNININNTATNNITQEGLSGGAGGVSVNGAVGLVNLERNATSTLSGTLNAKNKMTVNSTTDGTTTLDIKQGSAAGLLAANVSYADLTTSGVNAINVNGAKVNAAKELSVNTDDTSTSKVNSIGVAVSGTAAVGVLIADSTLESGNTINFNKATVESPTINITAAGSPSAQVKALAANAGAFGAATGLFAGTLNSTTNSLKADNATTFNSTGTLNLIALNNSSVTTKTDSTSASLGASGSVTAIKNVSNASSIVDVSASIKGNRTTKSTTSDLKSTKVTYYAEFDSNDEHLYDYFTTNPNIIIEDKSAGTYGGTHFKLSSSSEIERPWQADNFKTRTETTEQVIGTKTTTNYTGSNPTVKVSASATPTQKVDLVSIGAGGLLAATGAVANVQSNVNANVNASFEKINAESLIINSTAQNTPDIDVKGLTVGAIASGSNLIKADRNITASAEVGGDKVNVDNLTINTITSSTPDLYANGDGGGLVGISPAAAVIDDVAVANSTTTIKGKIDVRDDLNIKSINTDGGKVKADALGAAVIGGSGVSLNRNVNNNAAINIDSATITTGKSQTYTATNTLASNTDLEAAGYGGLNATAGGLTDKASYKSAINISGSNVKTTGDKANITMTANTEGEAYALNNLKAAGAIEVVVSESDFNTNFDNAINLKGSNITTTGDLADFTAATYDRTEQRYQTIANIQGGAAGVAGAEEKNTLSRSNIINLESSNINASSTNLNSGCDSENVAGKLTLTTFADVYNKTALPLASEPEMKNNLSVSGSVNLDSKSSIKTVRDVNIKAEAGTEIVTESAKEYNIYTNASGKGQTIVTTGHEGNPLESRNTAVNIDGNIETGIHNALAIDLTGESKVSTKQVTLYTVTFESTWLGSVGQWLGRNPNVTQTSRTNLTPDREVAPRFRYTFSSYSPIDLNTAATHAEKVESNTTKVTVADKEIGNLKATVTKGADFFDEKSIDMDGRTMVYNPYLKDYNQALSDMQRYTPGSTEHNKLKAQAEGIVKVMAAYGFADEILDSKGKGTGQYMTYESLNGPAIEIPNISVAGGNVDISAGEVKGTGKIVANAANELTINNATNKTLLVNDLVMDNAGGKVYLNDVMKSGNLNGISLTTYADVTAKVNINNTGNAYKAGQTSVSAAFTKAPDIVVNGSVNNSAGEVNIKNKNGSVLVNGQIYSMTATNIETPNGGTVIDNTGGLQNVGSDPMHKWTFGNKKFAEELQTYVGTHNTNINFSTYDEYLRWLWNDVRISWDRCNELSGLTGRNYNVDTWIKAMKAKYDNNTAESSSSIVAGGAVSVIAKTLNVNGLIQSGFNNYTATTSQERARSIYKRHEQTYHNYKDEEVLGKAAFRVNDTDEDLTYNSKTGMYDKVVGIYYNPKTGHILNEPINVTGGVVYLKATDLISTGNGKIVAAGGGANVNLTNNIETKVTGKRGVMEKVVNLDSFILKDINTVSRGDPLILINGTDYTKASEYKPNSKAVYGWTGAINYNTIYTKKAYTTSLFWGNWDIYKTDDLISKLNNEKISINTTDSSTQNGKVVDPGVFTDLSGNGSLFSITTNRTSGGVTARSEPSMMSYYKSGWHKFAGVKTYEYTWTETEPNYANTTYSVNAAQPVKIVTSNKKDISVNINNQTPDAEVDLIIDGDLNLTGNSTINLNSHGAIRTQSGSLTAKNVNLTTTAGTTNIDATIGTMLNNAATNLNVTANGSGTMNLKSNAKLENLNIVGSKADLNLTAGDLVSGKVITTGNVNIKSEDKIDITGNIGGTVNLTGDAGVKADVTGDLKIGKIESTGAVELKASGAIVNSVDKAVAMTGSAEKLQSWYDAGLISSNDSDDSSSNAAENEKSVRLKSLENLFKRWALRDEDSTETVKTYTLSFSTYSLTELDNFLDAHPEITVVKRKSRADHRTHSYIDDVILKSDYTFTLPDSLTTYNEVKDHSEETITYKAGTVDYNIYNKLINHTADTKDFTTEQLGQYNLYQELKTATHYGYSKNDLLYAIQEGILNPQAGLTANVPDPIITGKSVSLTAATIGKDLSPVTYKTLTDKTTLSKLAGAKMGDVTFNSNGTITMNEQSPVTIDLLDSNALTSITTKGKTYIAGTTRTALNINTDINVPDDKVVLMTGAGITDDRLLSAKQLELYAGGGDLKASNVAVGSGGLVVNALHDINISGGAGGASLSKDGTFTLPTGSNLSDYTFNNKDYTTWLTSYAKGNNALWRQFQQAEQASFRNYENYLNFVYRGLIDSKRSDILTNIAGSTDWYTFTGKNWGEYHNSYARFREMMMPKYSGSNNLSIKNVTAGDTVTITNNGKITALSSTSKIKSDKVINLTGSGKKTVYTATFVSGFVGGMMEYLAAHPEITSTRDFYRKASDGNPMYRYTLKSYSPIPKPTYGSTDMTNGYKTSATTVTGSDIGTKATPLYLDTLDANVNAGVGTAYLTGDYRYLTLKDASNDFTNQKQYYNLTTKDGGDYTLNTKKFINATNNKNNSYTIRAIGDLNLGNILGNTVSLSAGGNLVGSDISSEILNVRNLNMSGNNTENLKTTASSVTANLTGNLDLKYTGTSDFNLKSDKELKIKSLDAGSNTANITVNGNYTAAGTKDNIISSKLNMTATGDITLNNPSIRSQDTYTAENINITTTTNGQGKSYHDNNNLNAANVKRVEDPNNVYFQVKLAPKDPIDLNTDKHIIINSPTQTAMGIMADRDINISATSNMIMDVTNSNHNTNIDGGQNSLWLFTHDNNNLKGTINSKVLAITSDGDVDLKTDSVIDLLIGDKISIKTEKRSLKEIYKDSDWNSYKESVFIDTPTEVFFGSKFDNPEYNVKTGNKSVKIEAPKDFTLTTDNLNLATASVGQTLKVTSNNNIKGKINAEKIDLTAKGDVSVTSDQDLTGKVSAKNTELSTQKNINITNASNIGEVKNLTAEQVTIKKANLDTLDNVNAYRSAINATTANVYNKTSLNDSSAVYLYRTDDTTISAKDNVKYNIDTTKNLTVKGNNTKLGLSSAGEKFTFNGDTLTADKIAAKNIDLTATGDVSIDKLSMLGDYYYIDANNQWVSTDNNKYLRNHTELEVVSRRLSGRTWYYTLRSESPITRFNQSNITNGYEGTGERWKVFKAQGTKINDGKLNANVKGNLTIKSDGLVDMNNVEVGKDLTISAWNITGNTSNTYKAQNISLTSTDNANVDNLQKLTFDYDNSLMINTPNNVKFGAKKNNPNFKVNTGNKSVTINAAKNFTLTTDNLNLNTATVGGTLKVTSDKDITGTINSKQSNLTAKGNIDLKDSTINSADTYKAENISITSTDSNVTADSLKKAALDYGNSLMIDTPNDVKFRAKQDADFKVNTGNKSVTIEAAKNFTLTTDNLNLDTATVGETLKATSDKDITGTINAKEVDLTAGNDIKLSDLKAGTGGLTAEAKGNVDITGKADLKVKLITAGDNVTINNKSKITAASSDSKIKATNNINLTATKTVYTATFEAYDADMKASKYFENHPEIKVINQEYIDDPFGVCCLYTVESKSPIAKVGYNFKTDDSGYDIGTASTPLHLDAATVKVSGNNVNLASDKTLDEVKKWEFDTSLLVNMPNSVYLGDKRDNPTIDMKTGNKSVTIEASKNFTLTTDNLNLNTATVGETLKVTSDKDITGTINSKAVDLTADQSINITGSADLAVKNITAGDSVTIKNEGKITAVNKDSKIKATNDITLTAATTKTVKEKKTMYATTFVSYGYIPINTLKKYLKEDLGDIVENITIEEPEHIDGGNYVYNIYSDSEIKLPNNNPTTLVTKDVTKTVEVGYDIGTATTPLNLEAKEININVSDANTYLTSDKDITGKISAKEVDLTAGNDIKLSNLKAGSSGLTAKTKGKVDITGSTDLAIKNITAGDSVTISNVGTITAVNNDSKIKAGNNINLETKATSTKILIEKKIKYYVTTFQSSYSPATLKKYLKDDGLTNVTVKNSDSIGGGFYIHTVHSDTEFKMPYNISASNIKTTPVTEDITKTVEVGYDIGTATTPLYLDTKTININAAGANAYITGKYTNSTITAANSSSYKNYEEREYEEVELRQLAKALNESNILIGKFGKDYDNTVKAWLAGMGYSEAEEQKVIDLTRELYFNEVSGKSLFNAAVEQAISKYSEENLNAESTL